MSASLRFFYSLVLAGGVAACSDHVRPLNDPVPEGGDGGGQLAGSGGGAGTSNGGASSGGNSDGGASLGGTSAGAGPRGFSGPRCPLLTPTGCAANAVCIDDPLDDCNSLADPSCEGVCRATTRPSPCSGFQVLPPCPDGLTCVGDPLTEGFEDAPGICVGSRTDQACDDATNEGCPSGFQCMYGQSCAPNGVSCNGPVLCPILPGVCPSGYTHSTFDDCYGPCVPLYTCRCGLNADCPAGAVCDRSSGRCAELAENPCPDGEVLHETCTQCGPVGDCLEYETRCARVCTGQDECEDGARCLNGRCDAGGLCF